MSKITLYGASTSGNCLKTRWIADKMGIAYDWVEMDVFAGDTRTDEYLAINPAGQVPCMVRVDGRILAQSNAIMLYLAEGSDLIPADAFDRAKMMEWMFWEQYSHEPAIAVRRAQKMFMGVSEDDIDPMLMQKGRRALGVMELRLMARDFFVGETLTLADVALVAYTRVAHEGGFDLQDFPAVRAWVHRVERELGLDTIAEEELA
ncbi:glutathione S-transferase family protein [Hyphobacterium sp. HN65]|uniref:Glutathione S-transferase family protein n=1 Tax=Hyphobacterium lacteum TaxID=3116575 RepID=A0ABU7LQN6_9PROT|nr:glutathione S-transferase family protein [Hyphobacterium sp. HN65]MEE2526225.1 glutathione S-transferase family protein [Hyphobacterium sp. HN65]